MTKTVKSICDSMTKQLVKVQEQNSKAATAQVNMAMDLEKSAQQHRKNSQAYLAEMSSASNAIANIKKLFGA